MTRWTRGQRLRHDIGGQFVGDPRAFFAFVPLWWLLSMVADPDTSNVNTFAARMVANAIAFAACFGLLLVYRRTIFRHRHHRTVPLWAVISAGLGLGAMKAGMTVSMTATLLGDWNLLELLIVRVPAGAMTGAWFLPLAAIILATRDRFRAERDILIGERLSQSADTVSSRPVDSAHIRLRQLLDQVRTTIVTSSDQPDRLADSLTTLLDKKIRPLTHELWSEAGRQYTDFSAVDMARIVVSRHRYWPTLSAVAMLITNGPYVMSVVGWAEGTGRAVITATLAFVILTILSRGPAMSANRGALVLVIGVATFAAINEVLGASFFGTFPTLSSIESGIINATLFLALTLLLGVVHVALSEHRNIRKELETLLGHNYFAHRVTLQRIRERHRELAHLIHGRLQNQILGLVFALTRNPETSSPTALLKEIDLIDHFIAASADLPNGEEADVVNEMADLVARWRGIVTLQVSLGEGVQPTSRTTGHLMRVVEEAVTNAVRHGIASTVEVSLDLDHDHWIVTVTDDGLGPRQGRPGLGINTLRSLAGENWSLSADPETGGAILSARIPSVFPTEHHSHTP